MKNNNKQILKQIILLFFLNYRQKNEQRKIYNLNKKKEKEIKNRKN